MPDTFAEPIGERYPETLRDRVIRTEEKLDNLTQDHAEAREEAREQRHKNNNALEEIRGRVSDLANKLQHFPERISEVEQTADRAEKKADAGAARWSNHDAIWKFVGKAAAAAGVAFGIAASAGWLHFGAH